MSGSVHFFHPEETFEYHIEKCFCKVVFSNQQTTLVLEIESTEDLDHVEEDSLQNDYPKIVLSIEDFPVKASSRNELSGSSFSIPNGTEEITPEDPDEETYEVFYTTLNMNEEFDFETNENELSFTEKDGKLHLNWKGKADDFTENLDASIPFEVNCTFEEKAIEIEE